MAAAAVAYALFAPSGTEKPRHLPKTPVPEVGAAIRDENNAPNAAESDIAGLSDESNADTNPPRIIAPDTAVETSDSGEGNAVAALRAPAVNAPETAEISEVARAPDIETLPDSEERNIADPVEANPVTEAGVEGPPNETGVDEPDAGATNPPPQLPASASDDGAQETASAAPPPAAPTTIQAQADTAAAAPPQDGTTAPAAENDATTEPDAENDATTEPDAENDATIEPATENVAVTEPAQLATTETAAPVDSGAALAISAPVVTAEIPETQPLPDPVLPMLAGDAPAQGETPQNEAQATPTLASEGLGPQAPAHAPLTLAQVLPPGEAPAAVSLTAPSFDLVRVAPDGSMVIAGRAAPGANVQVLSGSLPVAEAVASARGEFVVFMDAPTEATLDMNIPEIPDQADLVVSQEDIVILPSQPEVADSAPIVVRRSPDNVEILQPASPAVPNTVSLDLVSYTASGAVSLAGRGQPGHTARIYANGVLAGETMIKDGGTWSLDIPEFAEGRYVLRIDEITPEGDVASRVETPFQRQFPEAEMPDTFAQGAKIIVQPGNTLWLMATQAYGHGDAYAQIFAANKDAIRDPDLIYPGQIFTIPREGE